MTESHLQALRKMITGAVQGTESHKQYGQMRKVGYISKTMGVMAGGKFVDKVEEKAKIDGGDLMEIAAKVRQGLSQQSKKWGLHLVYELALPEFDTVLFGTTGTPMDSKSFSIVRAGSDKSRKNLQCPGLAYAAAYPLEVVVTKDAGAIKVRIVEAMFRMKIYFEDAGKWAFMKNVKMPGSIDSEIEKQLKSALKSK